MADTVGQQDIAGLKVDTLLKGYALTEFQFKNLCNVASTSAMEVRWFQETNSDLTVTTPSASSNVSPLAQPTRAGPSWTRQTSYVKKYFIEDEIATEDIKSSAVDVVARTLLRLSRRIAKDVDSDIWDVITESQSASNINSTTTTSVGGDQWDAASYAGDPAADVLNAVRQIATAGYNIEGAELWVSPTDYESLVAWVYEKGAQAPSVGTAAVIGGTLTKFGGCTVRVNVNVTADYAAVVIPSTACTYYQHTPLSSETIKDGARATRYQVVELGIAVLTDPKAVTLIVDTQT